MRIRWLLLVVLVAACSPPRGWIGDHLTRVGPYTLDHVQPCATAGNDTCSIAVPVALAALGPTAADVTATSIADFPKAYADGLGGTALMNTGGFMERVAVILDTRDGTRRVVEMICGPVSYDDTGNVASRSCEAATINGNGNPLPSP